MRKSVWIQFTKCSGYDPRVQLPQYLQSEPYAARAVLCVLCAQSSGWMMLQSPFRWKPTGMGSAAGQRTSLTEMDGQGSG